MPSSALIIASTRAPADVQEVLRIQDTVSSLLGEGFSIDLLVPRVSPLLSVALAPGVNIYTLPHIPFCGNPPARPSWRRFILSLFMILRGIALVSRNAYTVLHGVNDGAVVAHAVDGFTLTPHPCIAEFHQPFALPCFSRGLCTTFARLFENRAFRHAAAVILPDSDTLGCFSAKLPRARVSLIPDPHAELSPDAFTIGEFNNALSHVYNYVLRPRFED